MRQENKDTMQENILKSIPILFLICFLILAICFSITQGRYEITLQQLYKLFMEKITGVKQIDDPFVYKIIFEVRLPRIIAAILVGGALSISGAVLQALFRNPMVSSDVLGVTSGAGFGASMGLLLELSYWKVELMAFGFGILAVSATYLLSFAVGKKNKIFCF